MAIVAFTATAGCTAEESPKASAIEVSSPIPESYNDYRVYRDYICGNLGAAIELEVEGTLLSINEDVFCPCAVNESCNTIQYPKHTAIVRIDRIVSSSEDETVQLSVEGSQTLISGASESQHGQMSGTQSEVKGAGKPLTLLTEGSEVNTHFILTVDPVYTRYIRITDSGNAESISNPGTSSLSPLSSEMGIVSNQKDSVTAGCNAPPLMNYNGRYVFTVSFGPDIQDKMILLPGLTEGSRFRTKALYNGDLYIDEYVLINGV